MDLKQLEAEATRQAAEQVSKMSIKDKFLNVSLFGKFLFILAIANLFGGIIALVLTKSYEYGFATLVSFFWYSQFEIMLKNDVRDRLYFQMKKAVL